MPLVCRRMSRNGILGFSAEPESKKPAVFLEFCHGCGCGFWISGSYKNADGYDMAYLKIWARKKSTKLCHFESPFMLVPRGPHPLHAPTLQASGLDEGAHQQKHRRLLRATGAIAFVFEKLVLILGLSSLCLYRNTGPVFGAPSWTCAAPGSPGPKCFFEDNLCFAKKKCFLRIVSCKL